MANSRDQFEERVRDTHKRLRRYEESLKELEAYFHERPQGAADALLLSVPVQLEVQRKYTLSRFGVDLKDREQRKRLRWTNLADAWEYTLLAYKYDVTDNAWSLMMLAHTTGERGERLARLVCAAYLLAWKRMPGMIAATIETFQNAVPHLANETGLAEYLTGHLATHTSMWTNRRLWAGIDERREEGETLFARLLKELPAEALAAYAEKPLAWGDLMDVRTEAVRRLEKTKPTSEAHELAGFVDQEVKLRLLKRGREVGLPPREYELLIILVEKPNISSREAGKALGITPGAVRALKSRIYKTLKVA
jgi:DNA-binding CsgD family transcriptional regulator